MKIIIPVNMQATAAAKDKVPTGKVGGEFDFDRAPNQVKPVVAAWNRANDADIKVLRAEEGDEGAEAFLIGVKETMQAFAEEHYGSKAKAKEAHPTFYK